MKHLVLEAPEWAQRAPPGGRQRPDDRPDGGDHEHSTSRSRTSTRERTNTMAVTMSTFYKFDTRGLPDTLKDAAAQDAFVQKVAGLLQTTRSTMRTLAAVVGMLVVDGFNDITLPSFTNGFWSIRGEAAGSVKQSDGVTDVQNKDIYDTTASDLKRLPGHKSYVYYQELAAVSRRLIANADKIPPDEPAFFGQIRSFADDYSVNGPAGDTLDLPDLTASGSADSVDDIRPDNIRAVAVIHASNQLEQLGLFRAVDSITETFMNGQLPVGFGSGGKQLDDYYWNSEFRLSEPARHMQYARVVGAPSTEKSTKVQPNTQFDDLMLRFVSALAEYDRQRRVADIVGSQGSTALSLTAEQVRTAGRNLAANASLYGWGGTQFAARRLATHIQTAFKILGTSEIQSAYGVTGPYQVIERVSTQDTGSSANIVKFRDARGCRPEDPEHRREVLDAGTARRRAGRSSRTKAARGRRPSRMRRTRSPTRSLPASPRRSPRSAGSPAPARPRRERPAHRPRHRHPHRRRHRFRPRRACRRRRSPTSAQTTRPS